MWLAANWSDVTSDLLPDLAHPRNLREAHRAHQAEAELPDDLKAAPAPKQTASIDGDTARKAAVMSP